MVSAREGSWQVGAGSGEGVAAVQSETQRKEGRPPRKWHGGGAGSRYYVCLIVIVPFLLCFSLLGVSSNVEEWPAILS